MVRLEDTCPEAAGGFDSRLREEKCSEIIKLTGRDTEAEMSGRKRISHFWTLSPVSPDTPVLSSGLLSHVSVDEIVFVV